MIKNLKASGQPLSVIHSDLHQWNIRSYYGSLSPIDFEDIMWGWPIQDIGNSLYYLTTHENFTALSLSFRKGSETLLP